jgi:hypothetical protein
VNARPRTIGNSRAAAVDGLVQRSVCGHLTEEVTERYRSVAQLEVVAALGKVAICSAAPPPKPKVVGNDVGARKASEVPNLQPAASA